MNPYTGHLVALEDGEAVLPDYEAIKSRFMRALAEKELAGRRETHVNLQARTPLAEWAKKKRKAKIAAKSRQRNRK